MRRETWFVGLLLAIALAVPSGAAGAGPKVEVRDEGERLVAVFKAARCKRGEHFFQAKATSTNRRFELYAAIRNFDGFHRYDVDLGRSQSTLLLRPRSEEGPEYGNEFVPPFPATGSGRIAFASAMRMRVSFGPAMWSEDSSSSVSLRGALECRYSR